jgi:hypothetical protein
VAAAESPANAIAECGGIVIQQKSPLDEAFQQELQRRLVLMDSSSGASGDFTSVDWVIITAFFIILPLFIVWLFR